MRGSRLILVPALVLALLFSIGCTGPERRYLPTPTVSAPVAAMLIGPRAGFDENMGGDLTGWEIVYAIPVVNFIPKIVYGFQTTGGMATPEHHYRHGLTPLTSDDHFLRLLQTGRESGVISEEEHAYALRHLATEANFPNLSVLQLALSQGAITEAEYKREVGILARNVIARRRGRNPNLYVRNSGLLTEAVRLGVVSRDRARAFVNFVMDDPALHDAELVREAVELGLIDRKTADTLLRGLFAGYMAKMTDTLYNRGTITEDEYEIRSERFADEQRAAEATFRRWRVGQ